RPRCLRSIRSRSSDAGFRQAQGSSSPLHIEPEDAVFGKVGVVVETRDLEPTEVETPVLNPGRRVVTLALEYTDAAQIHALDCRCSRVEHAGKDSLSEAEVVRVKHPALAVRLCAVTELCQERALHVAREIAAFDADDHLDFEGDKARRVDFQIVTGHPVAFE